MDPARVGVTSALHGPPDLVPPTGLLPGEPYRVRDLEVGTGYAAALAYSGPERPVAFHTMEGA